MYQACGGTKLFANMMQLWINRGEKDLCLILLSVDSKLMQFWWQSTFYNNNFWMDIWAFVLAIKHLNCRDELQVPLSCATSGTFFGKWVFKFNQLKNKKGEQDEEFTVSHKDDHMLPKKFKHRVEVRRTSLNWRLLIINPWKFSNSVLLRMVSLEIEIWKQFKRISRQNGLRNHESLPNFTAGKLLLRAKNIFQNPGDLLEFFKKTAANPESGCICAIQQEMRGPSSWKLLVFSETRNLNLNLLCLAIVFFSTIFALFSTPPQPSTLNPKP